MAAFIAYLASQHQTHQQQVQIQPANTYFAITDQAALVRGNFNASNPPKTVFITQFGFYITPIGGNATELTIVTPGMTDATNTAWTDVMPKGNTTFSGEIIPLDPIPSIRQSDGTYTMNTTFTCNEARGIVVLHFTPDELIGGF